MSAPPHIPLMLVVDLPYGLVLDLAAVLHALLASAVTMHAMLGKRDVRSAIGWIGLAWLSPGFGALLYYALGINRVVRRASRLQRGPAAQGRGVAVAACAEAASLPENIAIIAKVAERVTAQPLEPCNAVTPLASGDEAYPAMLGAIRGARRSVALASYIFRHDEAGRAFVDALAAAKARGVEVRVLIDGIGGGYLRSPASRALARRGVPVARFLHDWLPWRMSFLNMRSHRKILVVDGTVGFTGGINIGAENVAARRPPVPVADMHFRFEGPAVGQLMLAFAEDWNFTTGEALGAEWWPAPGPAGPVLARGITSGPDEDMGHLEAVLATAVAAARRRLRIVTPYFLPEQRLLSAIMLSALRGVAVDIVLPERSDHILLDWAMRGHLKYLTAPGITVSLTPPPFDHSKLLTVDGCWSLIGSANWDVRSTRLNFEFNVECYDAALAAALDRAIDRKIARARPFGLAELAARPLPLQLRDAAARLLLPYL